MQSSRIGTSPRSQRPELRGVVAWLRPAVNSRRGRMPGPANRTPSWGLLSSMNLVALRHSRTGEGSWGRRRLPGGPAGPPHHPLARATESSSGRGLRESPAGPGAVLGRRLPQPLGRGVRRRGAGRCGGDPAPRCLAEGVAGPVAGSLVAVAEAGGVPGGGPPGVGDGGRLEAVAVLRGGVPPRGMETATGGVAAVDAGPAEGSGARVRVVAGRIRRLPPGWIRPAVGPRDIRTMRQTRPGGGFGGFCGYRGATAPRKDDRAHAPASVPTAFLADPGPLPPRGEVNRLGRRRSRVAVAGRGDRGRQVEVWAAGAVPRWRCWPSAPAVAAGRPLLPGIDAETHRPPNGFGLPDRSTRMRQRC